MTSRNPLSEILDVLDEVTADPAPAKALPGDVRTEVLSLKLALSKMVDLLGYMTDAEWTKAEVGKRLTSIKALLD